MTILTQEQIIAVCKQIDDAKSGKGEMPTVEQMRDALDTLRANRKAAPPKGSKSNGGSAVPVNLDSLFN